MQVLHHCDNPPCINPKHLRLGTVEDNVYDALRKGRMKKPPMHPGISGVRGISFSRNRWRVQLWRGKRMIYVRGLKTREEAIKVLEKARAAILSDNVEEVLASLKKPRVKAAPKRSTRVQGSGWTARYSGGPRFAVLSAIDSFTTGLRFNGGLVYEAVQRLFPDTPVTRAHISSLLWKLSSSDKTKDRASSFRKITVSKGGNAQSEYEKLAATAA
jgi:hypothetical protein